MQLRTLMLASLATIVFPSPLEAANFVVNSVLDAVDTNPGDGICSDAIGDCTLRAAVMEANALFGSDVIQLPVGNYLLSIPPGEPGAARGSLDITDDLNIEGAGAGETIVDGGRLDRVIYATGQAWVQISDLTIQNGVHIMGGGILNGRSTMTLTNCRIKDNVAISHYQGAGIHNVGTLTLINTTVTGNTAERVGGGISNVDRLILIESAVIGNEAETAGGGIINWGVLTLSKSTLSGNDAVRGGGIYNLSGGAGLHDIASITVDESTISTNTSEHGGGIYCSHPLDITTLTNSTVSGNAANGTGGGISNSGTLSLTNSTIAGNSAGSGGGVRSNTAPVKMANSIVANSPSGGDCSGSGFSSLGYNLDSDNSCNLTASTDLPNFDPLLEPLTDNGGSTRTHALLSASPAVDAIPALACTDSDGNPVSSDQRGIPRPQEGACDIGSYELVSSPPKINSVWPNVAPVGDRLRITGTGFFFSAEVLFDEVVGIDVQIVDYSTLRVTVPNLPPGPADITVTTATGSAILPGGAGGFTVGERRDIIGMIADDATDSAVVFQEATTTFLAATVASTDAATLFQEATTTIITGTVPVGPGYIGDCAITMDRKLGFVTDLQSRLWVVDLAASPPSVAEGTNPIPISNLGEDVSISPDERFLVVCDGAEPDPISIVDIASRTEVSTFPLGTGCNAVDVCSDGSVLATSWNDGVVRRLMLDGSGTLTDTGEFLSVDGPMNVYCAPGSSSGVVVTWEPGKVLSFSIPGLSLVGSHFLSETYGVSGVVNPVGDRVFVRSNRSLWFPGSSDPGVVDVIEFDANTADLSPVSLFTIPTGSTFPFFGMDQMAVDPEGTVLYVSEPAAVNVYEAASGALLESITHPNIVEPTGICLPKAHPHDTGRGFVTGGGWIESPPGAYVPDETLIGKANFGFVAKYLKGAGAPTGQTEFQFKAADLNFHSAGYEWLVVAGPQAQFKGTGTVNGTGNFGFMITVIDGQIEGGGGVDKLWIRIWDENNDDLTVYDNRLGNLDSASVGGGSIVIHTDKQ